MAHDDTARVLQELELHQIELKQQNEELARTRDALEAALSRQTELYDLAPVGYVTLGPASEIRALNLEAARQLGRPRAELLEQRLTYALASESQAALGAFVERARRHEPGDARPTCTVIPRRAPAVRLRLEGRRAHGDELAVVLQDVSELSRAELERGRLARVVEQLDTAVTLTDPLGVVVFVNAAHERLTGYAREESIGGLTPVLSRDEAGADEVWSALRAGASWAGRRKGRHKDGAKYVEDVIVSSLRDEAGALTHFVVLQRDVSEQVALAEELQLSRRLEAVGRLAGGVAHDFNNMLLVIQNTASFLLDELDEGTEMREDLLAIADAATRSSNLTRQLLAFGRKQILRPESVCLDALVRSMISMLDRLLRENVRLRVQTEPGLWPVFADPGQLEQIVVNLAVNAQHAMPDGGDILVVLANAPHDVPRRGTALEGAPAGDFVRITVRDEGVGMDDEVKSHVFEPFFSTKGAQGTGLGLATVYGIVRQSDGFVCCESRPGEGSSFHVLLPRSTTPLIAREPGEAKLLGLTGRILLVEDEERVREIGRRMLAAAGHEVLTASNGEEALTVFQRHGASIDLVVSDVVMPVMGGAELRRRLLEARPELAVILTSGYPQDLEDSDILPKPFDRSALLTKVDQQLARRARTS